MYQIKNLLNPGLCLEEARNLWNQEMGNIYPISEASFSQNILSSVDLIASASGFAFDENGLIGFLFAKEFTDPNLPSYHHVGFISLFYISKHHRKQGVGGKLLEMCEQVFIQKQKTEIVFGRDYHNFFPGVPVDFDNLTGPWLQKRDYKYTKTTHDLINWQPSASYPIKNTQFEYRFATIADQENVLQFFERNFPGRWKYECQEFFDHTPNDRSYLIALEGESVIAFTRVNQPELTIIPYNLTWANRFFKLGALGPLGVDKAYRGIGLGADIVCAGLNELLKSGCLPIIIDWTGLLLFYQQFGFEVWKSYNCFSKQIE
jgi:predicted N-acetyltransferase YhbS